MGSIPPESRRLRNPPHATVRTMNNDRRYHDGGMPRRTRGGSRKQSDRVMCVDRPGHTLGHGHTGLSRTGIPGGTP